MQHACRPNTAVGAAHDRAPAACPTQHSLVRRPRLLCAHLRTPPAWGLNPPVGLSRDTSRVHVHSALLDFLVSVSVVVLAVSARIKVVVVRCSCGVRVAARRAASVPRVLAPPRVSSTVLVRNTGHRLECTCSSCQVGRRSGWEAVRVGGGQDGWQVVRGGGGQGGGGQGGKFPSQTPVTTFGNWVLRSVTSFGNHGLPTCQIERVTHTGSPTDARTSVSLPMARALDSLSVFLSTTLVLRHAFSQAFT
eukprot:7391877-Prymnesium_polylepis.2